MIMIMIMIMEAVYPIRVHTGSERDADNSIMQRYTQWAQRGSRLHGPPPPHPHSWHCLSFLF